MVDDCYEAATDASNRAGSISGGDSDTAPCDDCMSQSTNVLKTLLCIVCAGRCRNGESGTRGKHHSRMADCQHEQVGAEIGTPGPWGWLCVLFLD